MYDGYETRSTGGIILSRVLWTLVIAGVVYLAAVACVRHTVEHQGDPDNQYKIYDLAASDVLRDGWGFDVTKAQPLIIGGTIEGSLGEVNFSGWHGLFSGRISGEGRIQPASAIRIEVKDSRYSYNIEVPRPLIIFDRTARTPESATITWGIDAKPVAQLYKQVEGLGSAWKFSPYEDAREPRIQDAPEWPAIQRLGMGQLLAEHLEVVTIYLTEDQYQEYFQA